MRKHVKNYYKAMGIYPGEVVLCEVCNRHTVNIHHILFKSECGGDEAENLIALCVGSTVGKDCCHDVAHNKIKGKSLTREELFEIVEKRGKL